MEDFSAIPYSPRECDVEFIEALGIYELEIVSHDILLGYELREILQSKPGVKPRKDGFIRRSLMRLLGVSEPINSPSCDVYISAQVANIISETSSGVIKLRKAIALLNSKPVMELNYMLDNDTFTTVNMINRAAIGRLFGYMDEVSKVLSRLAAMRLARLSQSIKIEDIDKMKARESEVHGEEFYKTIFLPAEKIEPVEVLVVLLGCGNLKGFCRCQ